LLVKVKYFGKLRELLGVKREQYTLREGEQIKDLLLNYIPQKHKISSKCWIKTIFKTLNGDLLLDSKGMPILKGLLVLIEGKSHNLVDKLKDLDEVALLPPFGGG
jgi:molybdopterin converting factor small subunit